MGVVTVKHHVAIVQWLEAAIHQPLLHMVHARNLKHALADHWIFHTTRSSNGLYGESALQASGTSILHN